MHELSHLLVIAIACNLDNLGVGVTYGLRRIAIPPLPNLMMALIAFLFTVLSAHAARLASLLISERAGTIGGAVLMIGFGLLALPAPWVRRAPRPEKPRASLRDVQQRPELADRDHSGTISPVEALLLGTVVSLNCLANGLPAGLWHLRIMPLALGNAILSYGSIALGVWLGRRYGEHWLGRKADWVAGLLLVALGVHQLF